MKTLPELLFQLQNVLFNKLMCDAKAIRGAEVLSPDNLADDPRIVIFGSQAGEQLEAAKRPDYEAEMEMVRVGLNKLRVKETVTCLLSLHGYFVVVTPVEGFDKEGSEEHEVNEFTEKGKNEFNVLVKRCNDLAWHAWAVVNEVSLKEPPARLDAPDEDSTHTEDQPVDDDVPSDDGPVTD